jgi:flagellar assembly factor FliW
MRIDTKFFGTIEIADSDILVFYQGIPGFENYRRFIISEYRPESPFFILQSVDLPELALIMIEYRKVVPDFTFNISDADAVELGLEHPGDAAVFAIVVLPSDITKATVNLAAPVLINQPGRRGKQVFINNPNFSLRHSLFAPYEAVMMKKTVAR